MASALAPLVAACRRCFDAGGANRRAALARIFAITGLVGDGADRAHQFGDMGAAMPSPDRRGNPPAPSRADGQPDNVREHIICRRADGIGAGDGQRFGAVTVIDRSIVTRTFI